jgi:hypothetical protein
VERTFLDMEDTLQRQPLSRTRSLIHDESGWTRAMLVRARGDLCCDWGGPDAIEMSTDPPPRKPSDPDPHLPDPTRPNPTREPMRPPRETPAPKIDPPGPTPERPRRP